MDALDAKTVQDFEALGVRFAIAPAGEIRVAGPPRRTDVHAALRAEVSRRAELLASKLRKGRRPEIAAPVAHTRTGACDTCGNGMPRFRGGMCALCALAVARALRQARGPS